MIYLREERLIMYAAVLLIPELTRAFLTAYLSDRGGCQCAVTRHRTAFLFCSIELQRSNGYTFIMFLRSHGFSCERAWESTMDVPYVLPRLGEDSP